MNFIPSIQLPLRPKMKDNKNQGSEIVPGVPDKKYENADSPEQRAEVQARR